LTLGKVKSELTVKVGSKEVERRCRVSARENFASAPGVLFSWREDVRENLAVLKVYVCGEMREKGITPKGR
jgi:hypothetical protein